MTKQTRQQMMDELYEVLADKTLAKGCFVITNQYSHIGRLELLCADHRTRQGDWKVISSNQDIFYQNESQFKIIGAEPTLNDVLLKLGEKLTTNRSWVVVDNEGEVELFFDTESFNTLCTYDLAKSFDLQSDRTITALFNLICKK